MNGWQCTTYLLALRRNAALLLRALVLALTGKKLCIGFAPEYLQTLGAGAFIGGLYDALQTLLGATYAHPGCWLSSNLDGPFVLRTLPTVKRPTMLSCGKDSPCFLFCHTLQQNCHERCQQKCQQSFPEKIRAIRASQAKFNLIRAAK